MDLYLWVKAGHVLAIISWMAAILYLPRLFIYHIGAPAGSTQSETFKVMERRLYKGIMTPAMIATWVFGIWLVVLQPEWFQGQGWLHAKLVLVVVMSAIHGILGKHRRNFEADRNVKSTTYFRVINEVPTVLLIGIVILVIVKPF